MTGSEKLKVKLFADGADFDGMLAMPKADALRAMGQGMKAAMAAS